MSRAVALIYDTVKLRGSVGTADRYTIVHPYVRTAMKYSNTHVPPSGAENVLDGEKGPGPDTVSVCTLNS